MVVRVTSLKKIQKPLDELAAGRKDGQSDQDKQDAL